MTHPLASSLRRSSTSATTTERPSVERDSLLPPGRRMVTPANSDGGKALVIDGRVRPLAAVSTAQTGEQCRDIPQRKRQRTTLAHTEAVTALRSLGPLVTLGRAVRLLGWSLYEARFWLEKLSGQRVLVATRRGHVWAEGARW